MKLEPSARHLVPLQSSPLLQRAVATALVLYCPSITSAVSKQDIERYVADSLRLTDAARRQRCRLPEKKHSLLRERIGQVLSDMRRAGILSGSGRDPQVRVSQEGLDSKLFRWVEQTRTTGTGLISKRLG